MSDPKQQEALLIAAGYSIHDNGTGTGWYALPPGEAEFIHNDEAGRHSYLGFFSSKQDLLNEIYDDLSNDVMGFHSLSDEAWAAMDDEQKNLLAVTRLAKEFPPATYTMQILMTNKVWSNVGNGWGREHDWVLTSVNRQAVVDHLNAKFATMDFNDAMTHHTLSEVTGGEIQVDRDIMGIDITATVTIHTRFALDAERLKMLRLEVSGQILYGWGASIDDTEVAAWDNGRGRDYKLTTGFDFFSKLTDPQLVTMPANKPRTIP